MSLDVVTNNGLFHASYRSLSEVSSIQADLIPINELCAMSLELDDQFLDFRRSSEDENRYVWARNSGQKQEVLKAKPISCYLFGQSNTFYKKMVANPFSSLCSLKYQIEVQLNRPVVLTINGFDLPDEKNSLLKYTYEGAIIHINRKQIETKHTLLNRVKIKQLGTPARYHILQGVSSDLDSQSLCERISMITGISAGHLRLTFGGRLLDKQRKVYQYGVSQNATIHAIDLRRFSQIYIQKSSGHQEKPRQIKPDLNNQECLGQADPKHHDSKISSKQNPQAKESLQEGTHPTKIEACETGNQFHGTSHPLVISGCSGAGKGTIIKYLLQRYGDIFELSVSYTTRQPRQGEKHGVEYYFVSVEQFQSQINKGVFIEHGKIYGNYYGTHKSELERIAAKKKICILEVDLTAAQKMFAQDMRCHYLFIKVDGLEKLRQRMIQRGTQSEEKIQIRMKHSEKQLQTIKQLTYYEHIMNQDLAKTKNDLINYLKRKYGLSDTIC